MACRVTTYRDRGGVVDPIDQSPVIPPFARPGNEPLFVTSAPSDS